MSFDEHDLGVVRELEKLTQQVKQLTEAHYNAERATQSMIQASEGQTKAGQSALETRLGEIGRQLSTSHDILERHMSESKVAWKGFRDDIDRVVVDLAQLHAHVDRQADTLKGEIEQEVMRLEDEIEQRIPTRPFRTFWTVTKGFFAVIAAGAGVVGAAYGLHSLHWLGF